MRFGRVLANCPKLRLVWTGYKSRVMTDTGHRTIVGCRRRPPIQCLARCLFRPSAVRRRSDRDRHPHHDGRTDGRTDSGASGSVGRPVIVPSQDQFGGLEVCEPPPPPSPPPSRARRPKRRDRGRRDGYAFVCDAAPCRCRRWLSRSVGVSCARGGPRLRRPLVTPPSKHTTHTADSVRVIVVYLCS